MAALTNQQLEERSLQLAQELQDKYADVERIKEEMERLKAEMEQLNGKKKRWEASEAYIRQLQLDDERHRTESERIQMETAVELSLENTRQLDFIQAGGNARQFNADFDGCENESEEEDHSENNSENDVLPEEDDFHPYAEDDGDD